MLSPAMHMCVSAREGRGAESGVDLLFLAVSSVVMALTATDTAMGPDINEGFSSGRSRTVPRVLRHKALFCGRRPV
jgi:hypothetical protein